MFGARNQLLAVLGGAHIKPVIVFRERIIPYGHYWINEFVSVLLIISDLRSSYYYNSGVEKKFAKQNVFDYQKVF